ncbi:MAG: hypothetical protein ACRD0P_37985, partial [Stackebrandtia sp.]
ALVLAASFAQAPSARAATFTVTNLNDSGTGSFRQAILDANASAGADTIAFDIPGTGPHTIQPTSPLPTITDAVTIDGYSEPGAAVATNPPATLMIELDGTNAGAGADGLTITAAGSTVKGLVINRFSDKGIFITGGGATGNTIEGNYIGTDVTGEIDRGNGEGVTVFLPGATNTIGGSTTAARNVISGNGFAGVLLIATSGQVVRGNYIGTDDDGNTDLGNGNGVYTDGASGAVVGGTAAGARNVISGNDGDGITTNSSTVTIQGNLVGTDVTGAADLGNAGHGVSVFRCCTTPVSATVGGTAAGAANVIANNGGDGVAVTSSGAGFEPTVTVRGNSIYDNGQLGIDLKNDGV